MSTSWTGRKLPQRKFGMRFPEDFSDDDLKRIIANNSNIPQDPRRIEMAQDAIDWRAREHQRTGHYINILG